MKRQHDFSRELTIAVRCETVCFPAILILVSCLASIAVFGKPAVADEGEKRQVLIDPISRNFMKPSPEDFLRPNDFGLSFEEVRFRNEMGSDLRGWFLPADGGR